MKKQNKINIHPHIISATNKKRTRQSLHCEGYGSHEFLKIYYPVLPLKRVVEKNCVAREYLKEQNKHQAKSLL